MCDMDPLWYHLCDMDAGPLEYQNTWIFEGLKTCPGDDEGSGRSRV